MFSCSSALLFNSITELEVKAQEGTATTNQQVPCVNSNKPWALDSQNTACSLQHTAFHYIVLNIWESKSFFVHRQMITVRM